MVKVVVACDSFKGSLTAAEASAAVAKGVREGLGPSAEVVEVPVADGGEGTLEMVAGALDGQYVSVAVTGPLGNKTTARYAVIDGDKIPDDLFCFSKSLNDSGLAVIEMAQACGLTLLAAGERNPIHTSTRGLGEMIADAYDKGCRRFIIGLGGSATNDGGAGMLKALGARFLDKDGSGLGDGGGELTRLCGIDVSGLRRDILDCGFVVLCDVDNPLCGPDGASAVFGPQKGATAEDVELLDRGLARYASVVEDVCGRSVGSVPGAGAAGGTAAAFLAFFNCRLSPGIETMLRLVGFDGIVSGASMVFTGEGRIDSQTLGGKAPYGVMCVARRLGVPVVALAGEVYDVEALNRGGFTAALSVLPEVCDSSKAMERSFAAENLRMSAIQVCRLSRLNVSGQSKNEAR